MANKVNRGSRTEPYKVSKALPPEKDKKPDLKVVHNDNMPEIIPEPEPATQELYTPEQGNLEPQDQPMYTLSWVVQLNYKDKMGEHTLGTYSNTVMYDTQKLLERAATMVGQQVFQKIVEDQNV